MRLAKEIVTMYHSPQLANNAEAEFNAVFAEGALPETIIEIQLPVMDVAAALKEIKVIESKSEWTRLCKEGALSIHEGDKITDPKWKPESSCVLRIGKRRFVRFV
jgi:tyrosyl-tRNA synthetase